MEEWKWVSGGEGIYKVSNQGRVMAVSRSGVRQDRILRPTMNHRGYLRLNLSAIRKGLKPLVHCVVAKAWLGQCSEGMEVNHKNGDKTDNSVSNLEYVTARQNVHHAIANGLRDNQAKGERIHAAVLTEADVRAIRELAKTQTMTSIGRTYGITRQAVGHIVRRTNWRHVA